jgi:hypothetical protein
VAEALETHVAEALVAPLIVETAPMPVAQHVVGLGYQLEPLLGARIARVAVRVVAESQLTKSALDLVEGRGLADTKYLVVIAIRLHGSATAGSPRYNPDPMECAPSPFEGAAHITVAAS